MATIIVPAPPKSAFNKYRPVSDLLHGQLKHFHHIELTLPPALRSNVSPRDYATEEGAARYIAHLTNALQTMGQAAPAAPIPIRRPAAKPSRGLAIAAGAAPAKPSAKAAKSSKTFKLAIPKGKKG